MAGKGSKKAAIFHGFEGFIAELLKGRKLEKISDSKGERSKVISVVKSNRKSKIFEVDGEFSFYGCKAVGFWFKIPCLSHGLGEGI